MSWADVFKINSNIKKPINKLIQESRYNVIKVITATGTYKPSVSGLYRVICVGKGGDSYIRASSSNGNYVYGGGGGGVAIKDIRLDSATSYNVTVSTTASFANQLTATAGETLTAMPTTAGGTASGGTASGGTYNFVGEKGKYGGSTNVGANGGSVGVVITELMRSNFAMDDNCVDALYGDSILNYGGGAPCMYRYRDSRYVQFNRKGLPAAVIIIPMVLEG